MSQAALSGSSSFHLSRSRAVAALGRVAPVAGVGVLAVVICSALLEAGTARTVALALAWTVTAIGLVLTCLAAIRAVRPPLLVRLDDDGFRVHVLRGAGPSSAGWSDVRAVRRESLGPGPCVVVELADGRRSVVPERLVDEGGPALAAALGSRLDRAHGQHRL